MDAYCLVVLNRCVSIAVKLVFGLRRQCLATERLDFDMPSEQERIGDKTQRAHVHVVGAMRNQSVKAFVERRIFPLTFQHDGFACNRKTFAAFRDRQQTIGGFNVDLPLFDGTVAPVELGAQGYAVCVDAIEFGRYGRRRIAWH